MSIEVRRLGPDDWRDWRDLRLSALAESPSAFGATFSQALGYAEEDWRRRTTNGVVAYDADQPVALGAGFPEDGRISVVSMWTDPRWRGQGIGGAVLDAVVAMGAERGLGARLFVMRANPDVARLYERRGFRRTGLVEEHGGRIAEEMVLEPQAEP